MDEENHILAKNKKVYHDFTIGARWEAGVVLTGSEVKSCRNSRIQLRDSFARFMKGELWLVGVHISPYENGAYANHPPVRPRKLLLHQAELKKIQRQVEEKGATVVPLTVYLKRGKIKVELGLATGKKQYDKRATIAAREEARELDRTMKKVRSGIREED
ncbi:MAG: SsrA-binding protein SmpB [bacterium]|nr:SsrA-binding protein SmpB [bacterium]